MRIKPVSLVTAAALAAMVLTQSLVIGAAEIKVLCSNGIREVIRDLIPQFEKATGNKVAVTFGLSAALKRQIDGGEPFDLAILTPPLIDDLVKRGTVAADARIVLVLTGAGFKYDPPALPAPVDLTGSEDDIVAAVLRAVGG